MKEQRRGTGGAINVEFPQSKTRLVTREFKDCLNTKLRLLKWWLVSSTQTKNSGYKAICSSNTFLQDGNLSNG